MKRSSLHVLAFLVLDFTLFPFSFINVLSKRQFRNLCAITCNQRHLPKYSGPLPTYHIITIPTHPQLRLLFSSTFALHRITVRCIPSSLGNRRH